MAKRKKSTELGALSHKDDRVNIPTGELAGFVEEDEQRPGWITYPRDPSLSPQLVWVGKDDQDAGPLDVPAVPIYIQEKIHPQAIVEGLRDTAGEGEDEPELKLFEEFDRLDFEELVDFYQHRQNWSNRLILGDSLQVMGSLAEKEGLRGRVQMIYLDPPYGIKFGSNWQVSTRSRDVKDGKAEDLVRQPEQIRAFRDTWELGIHSYLAYLRDRLVLARDLLTESGSIFVQIGDENVHLVRSLMDEVFGADNFASQIAVTKSGGGLDSSTRIPSRLDYLLWYARDLESMQYQPLFEEREDLAAAGFTRLELPSGERRGASLEERTSPPEGTRLFRTESLTKPGPGAKYEIKLDGVTYDSGRRWWGTPKPSLERLIAAGRVVPVGNTLRFIRYADDFPYRLLSNLWDGLGGASSPVYVVQTNPTIIQRCMLMTTRPGDLVLDPSSGSGTTAVVAEEWGRRWIAIDTSRVAVALARARLMGSKYPYYLLADSAEGQAKENQITGVAAPTTPTNGDVRKGFVYRRVPHITLAAIAQNPDIEEGMTREEIEAAIVRRGESEILVDQPYEEKKKVRVTGPFTVESLSPHRLLDPDVEQPATVQAARRDPDAQDFATIILDNLRAAGVKTTTKGERIDFNSLDLFAGRHITAEGRFTDANGDEKRVAVCIGPEHGTVGQTLIREAAKEALRGFGFDMVLVCGFAFDAHAASTAEELTAEAGGSAETPVVARETKLGSLPVLLVRMNPDLAMGDDLLKKTGTGNLFMVFGEPDLAVKEENSQLTVNLRGVDVYDPTTGTVRSNSTDDVMAWFIDTAYNGESFFIRHAYFTGDDDPYERLRKVLKADIDPEVWESLYRTTSRPFPRPDTGRIGVKVINHYGDEVLKTYNV